MGVTDPYLIGCAVTGAFVGAVEIMYKSDYDVHNAVFVDHLNNGQVHKVIQTGIIQRLVIQV